MSVSGSLCVCACVGHHLFALILAPPWILTILTKEAICWVMLALIESLWWKVRVNRCITWPSPSIVGTLLCKNSMLWREQMWKTCNLPLLVTKIQQMEDIEMQCDVFAAHIPTFLIYKKVFLLHMQRILHVCNYLKKTLEDQENQLSGFYKTVILPLWLRLH